MRTFLSAVLCLLILVFAAPSNVAADGEDAVYAPPVPDNLLYTGAATYRIPVEVPPGRRGIAPNIALTYNSYNKNGWVGVGWDLDAGSIQRATKKGIDYSAGGFVFFINGSSSELVKRDDWGSGYYGAKIEGAFYKFHHDTASDTWTVSTKDGTKYYFGSAPNSRQTNVKGTFRWYLSSVQDADQNYMTLTYQQIGSMKYLSEIDYTGNTNGPEPTNHVYFNLEGRTDEPSDRTSAVISYRLKNIEIRAGTQLVSRYELGYGYSPSSYRSLLTSVTRYGNDGSTTLPPVSFSYTVMTQGYSEDTLISWNTPRPEGTTWPTYVRNTDKGTYFKVDENTDTTLDTVTYEDIIDMNGDGLPDRVTANGADNKSYLNVYLNNGVYGFDNEPVQWLAPNGSWPYSWPLCPMLSNTNGVYQALIDMNGDGLPDLVVRDGNDILVYLNVYSQETGAYAFSDTPVDWNAPHVSSWSNYIRNTDSYGVYQDIIDMNGDGLPDRVVAASRNAGEQNMYVYLNTGNRFSDTPITWPSMVMDGSWRQYPQTQGLYGVYQALIDMNGDGMPDRVANQSDTNGNPADTDLAVVLNSGSGFDMAMLNWVTPKTGDLARYVRPVRPLGIMEDMIDMNGDGLPDRVSYNGSDCSDLVNHPELCDMTYFYVSPNNGSGFSSDRQVWSLPVVGAGGSWRPGPQNFTSSGNVLQTLIDINGDGLPDRVTANPGFNGNLQVYLSQGPFPDLLKTIDNGLGGETTITYVPSTQYANHYLPFVIQTVYAITTNDGNGNSSAVHFSYSGGMFDSADREFRGFEYVKQTNPDGTTVETSYHQDDHRKGLAKKQTVRDSGGSIYSETDNIYDDATTPYLRHQYSLVYDGTQTFRVADLYFEYDPYGNVTLKKYSHGDQTNFDPATLTGDLVHDKDETVDYQYDDTNWIMSLPLHSYLYDKDGVKKAQTIFEYRPATTDLKTQKVWLKDDLHQIDTELTTTYGYDPYGNLTSVTDPRDNAVTTTYETTTNTYPQTVTNKLGHTSTADYDYRFGKLHTQADVNGNQTSYQYDPLGRLTKVTNPNDGSSAYGTVSTTYPALADYGKIGTQQKVTKYATEVSGTGQYIWKETWFDGFGRTIKTRAEGPDSTAIIVETKYNNMGRVWKTSEPYFEGLETEHRWTTYTYDPVGRVTRIDNPDGTHVSRIYNKGVTTSFDAKNRQRVEERDIYGRLTTVKEYTGATDPYVLYASTRYDYDILNNLIKVTDNSNNQTGITYDTLGRKTSITDPDMGHWTYAYDASGNLISQTDAKNQTIYFQYDPINRLKQKDYGSQKVPGSGDIVYTYDEAFSTNSTGRLTTVADASGATKFYYDKLGQATKTVKTMDKDYPVEMTYDAMGRTNSIKYPDGEIIRYEYNTGGGIYRVITNDGSLAYAAFTNYNAAGQVKHVAYANGKTYTDYQYNVDSSALPQNNRLYSITANSTAAGGLQNVAYRYDDVGNITKITNYMIEPFIVADPVNESYSYSYPKPHAVSNAGAKTFGYDANGNMTNDNGTAITYNYDNMPETINGNVSFVYDYAGQRVKKTTPTATTIYIGKLYECTNGACSKHIYAGSQRIATKMSDGTTYYYHTDHLGSSTVITDQNGSIVEQIKYYGFGATRYQSGDVTDYKYTGQEYDPETGLYYYNARYYDPALGMFISADSVVPDPTSPQDLNRYVYAANNPLIYSDPSGHNFWESLFSGFMAGVTLALTGNPAFAGMVAGATSSAMNGGNILEGTVTGGLTGGVAGELYSIDPQIMGPAMLAGGAGMAYASGGTQGLADYGGGILGGLVGLSLFAPSSANNSANNRPEIIRSDTSTGIKVIFHPEGSSLFNAAMDDPFRDMTLLLYGHSNGRTFAGMDATALADFIEHNVSGWNPKMDIFLNGCRAGNGIESIAAQLSVKMPNNWVRGPSERLWARPFNTGNSYPPVVEMLGGRGFPNLLSPGTMNWFRGGALTNEY